VRARGIDPGTAAIGWCDIERESAGVYRWIAHGVIEPKEIVRGGKMPIDDYGIDVFAVETPEEMHVNDVAASVNAARGRAHGSTFTTSPATGAGRIVQTVRCLIETAKLAERICGLLVQHGKPIVEPTAADCRRALGVRFGAQRGKGVKLTPDQQVKEKLHLYVRGWPERSNVHVRDAGAAAFLALVMAENAAEVEPRVTSSGFLVPPPGTYGSGDYGPDSFGGSDYE
jgi:hypothetical protein